MSFEHEPLGFDRVGPLYAEHIEHLNERVGAVLTEHGLDALVISAGSRSLKSPFDDQKWPFRPTPAFAHWIPLRDAGSALVIEPGATPRLIRAIASGFWHAPPRIESHHMWSEFELIEAELQNVRSELPPTRACAFIGDDPARARAWGFSDEQINPPELVRALDAIRTRKTGYEIECVRVANRIAARGHARLAERFTRADDSELALHLLYLGATGQDDSETPYKNIVAVNENAATLHHDEYDRSPRGAADRSLLVDAGAVCLGYASDVTRTWVKGEGAAAGAFSELIRRLDELQRTIIAEIAPGLEYEALHDRTHESLARVLRDLEIVRADPEAIVESGATRAFFPHGLGHSLGVQVHDVGLRPREPRPENTYLRNTGTIAIGQVLTIEPGCYFIPSLMDELRGKSIAADIDWTAVDALRPLGGVRIEDNIAVTETGVDNLTRPALDEALAGVSAAP